MLSRTSQRFPFQYFSRSAREVRPQLDRLWRSEARGIRPLGLGWGTANSLTYLILPLWLLPLLTAIPPVRWWRARRRVAAQLSGRGRGGGSVTIRPRLLHSPPPVNKLICTILAATVLALGCTPEAYKRSADRQVQNILHDRKEKTLGYVPEGAA